jgi:hypothetical protein
MVLYQQQVLLLALFDLKFQTNLSKTSSGLLQFAFVCQGIIIHLLTVVLTHKLLLAYIKNKFCCHVCLRMRQCKIYISKNLPP